ncbi:MAG: hypothetical protein H6732_09550 [Alphaproteobacteria bacterium]|nr:hypothetical protein [Alphaproteobacteria bacterium]
MQKLAAVSLFVVLSACATSRSSECEVAACDDTVVSACKTAVETCETAGVLVDTCITAALSPLELCDSTTDTDSETM